ncbi:hypothetical protein GCM10009424_21140 [Sphingomonas ursincola]|uniref:TIGR02281 family clan AA aspartic protease n=1 Tax=Sphingomonas ursincola TaxID=56361 RepID=A0A7V8RCJ1_9SPHN|nr:retropepsin-like aspartic protease [Sphingomonas ursincola]MBA1373919.1 TIGR02281 family clan AA aspartic protease [Sphingomonas ursincola]
MGTFTEIVCVAASLGLGLGALGVDWHVYGSPSEPPPPRILGNLAQTPAEAGEDGRMFVNGQVNGTPIRFMVDTGSTVTILNARDAQRAGLADQGHYIPIAGLAGRVEAIQTSVDELVIGQARKRNVDLFVVKDLEHSLLGIDMLRHAGPLHLRFDVPAS